MTELIIDGCEACEPVKSLVNKLVGSGFEVLDAKLEDYHFHQLYFKINAKIDEAMAFGVDDFVQKENFLICNCHWSRIEFVG